ncbi:MAG: MerR family transcriptional regulator [Thermodesulfobacteriota bacterium]
MTRETQPRTPEGVAPDQVTIPDKLYFKIGEVCELTGVKQHVLRYWETEFPFLHPQRAGSKQRLYRRSDVENILRIKRLLREEGFTISGAKKLLSREQRGEEREEPASPAVAASPPSVMAAMQDIRNELQELKRLLEE